MNSYANLYKNHHGWMLRVVIDQVEYIKCYKYLKWKIMIVEVKHIYKETMFKET